MCPERAVSLGPGHPWSGLGVDICGLASQLQSQPGAWRGGPSVARWQGDLSTGVTRPLQGLCGENDARSRAPAPELACPARTGGVIKPICFLGRPSQPNPFHANQAGKRPQSMARRESVMSALGPGVLFLWGSCWVCSACLWPLKITGPNPWIL